MKLVLADLGFERNADSIRGFIVQAWLITLLAVVSSWSVLRSFRKAVPATADDAEWRGVPFMKHTMNVVLRLIIGVMLVAGAARAARWLISPPLDAIVINPPSEATVLALGNDGVLHVGARSGYYTVDRAGKKTVPTGVEARDLRHTAGALMDNEDVWLASEQGLFQRHGEHLTKIAARDGSDLGPAFCLLRKRDGSIVAGGAGKLMRRTADGSWEAQTGIALERLSVLYEDKRGRLWAGCDVPNHGGLLRLDAGAASFVDASQGLPHSSVCDLTEDAGGTLWIATGFAAFGGAARWDEATSRWLTLEGPPGLEGRKIRSLFLDSTGALWFCSEYDGIAIKKGDAWHQRLYRQGLPCREVIDTIEADGGFWMATERGVLFLDKHPLANLNPAKP